MKLSALTIATATALTSVGALFTLIGLTTPRWLRSGFGIWNCTSVCSTSAAFLTILALILLVISIILLIFILLDSLPDKLRIIPLILLIISTICLLSSNAIYLRRFRITGFSFDLIVTAHTFAFFSSILLAFWYGTQHSGNVIRTTIRSAAPPSNVVFNS